MNYISCSCYWNWSIQSQESYPQGLPRLSGISTILSFKLPGYRRDLWLPLGQKSSFVKFLGPFHYEERNDTLVVTGQGVCSFISLRLPIKPVLSLVNLSHEVKIICVRQDGKWIFESFQMNLTVYLISCLLISRLPDVSFNNVRGIIQTSKSTIVHT